MKYLICAIIKNEHKYLAEWIDYHLSLGFDDIYLVEDYGSISHKEITDKYPNVHLTTCDDYFIVKRDYDLGNRRQNRVYQKFITNHKNEGWCAFIDIDEFIVLKDGYTLQSLTEEYKDVSALAMFWQFYNANGRIFSSNSVIDDYTQKSNPFKKDKGWCFKSFVNLNKSESINSVHQAEGLVDINRNPVYKGKTTYFLYDKIQLNHYFTKSYEDWCQRFKRGDLMRNNRKFNHFFELNPDMNPEETFMKYTEPNSILIVGDGIYNDNIDVNKYDKIIMFNRMNNFDKVGRCDIWFADIHEDFFNLVNKDKIKEALKSVQKILIPKTNSKHLDRFLKEFDIHENNIIIVDINTFEKCNDEIEEGTYTTTYLYIQYLLKYINKPLDITAVDIKNRYKVLSNHDAFRDTWHINALKREEKELKKLVKKGVLHEV